MKREIITETKGIFSRGIIKESCESLKVDNKKHVVFNHLSLAPLPGSESHILHLKNVDRVDLESLAKADLNVFFSLSHEQPGLQLVKLDENFINSKEFALEQEKRSNLFHNVYDIHQRRSKDFVEAHGYVTPDAVFGIVVTNVCDVPKVINWILKNK